MIMNNKQEPGLYNNSNKSFGYMSGASILTPFRHVLP